MMGKSGSITTGTTHFTPNGLDSYTFDIGYPICKSSQLVSVCIYFGKDSSTDSLVQYYIGYYTKKCTSNEFVFDVTTHSDFTSLLKNSDTTFTLEHPVCGDNDFYYMKDISDKIDSTINIPSHSVIFSGIYQAPASFDVHAIMMTLCFQSDFFFSKMIMDYY
jgi:hypothetical protein